MKTSKSLLHPLLLYFVFIIQVFNSCQSTESAFVPKTSVAIRSEKFLINGEPTFKGRSWNGYSVEGLLPNSRMVQGIFDDFNPETVDRWKYPDTNEWSADQNTSEFIAAMPSWREHGLLAFTINMQGGSPMGYGNKNWQNPGYDEAGNPIPDYLKRMKKIIQKADELGMVVILGYFYFGQDQFLKDEAAIINATERMTSWVLKEGFTNVIIEVANESDNSKYDHDIISRERIHELIKMAQKPNENGKKLLAGTSFNGTRIPSEKVVEVSDFILIHGNGAKSDTVITEMVNTVRSLPTYTPKPIVFNEDDHFDFDKPANNFVAATKAYASWGYFDFRMDGEGFDDGFQSVPVNWEISSERKKAFFNKVKEIFID